MMIMMVTVVVAWSVRPYPQARRVLTSVTWT